MHSGCTGKIQFVSSVYSEPKHSVHPFWWGGWLGQAGEMLPVATKQSEVKWPIWESNPQPWLHALSTGQNDM